MLQDNHQSNGQLNTSISFDEVERQINKAKFHKATGCDNIPNEVLKSDDVKIMLYKLFVFCFENSKVPVEWMKAIINPIPKGSDKNPYLPLSYRGISLLSCIGKIYTGILNSRITKYLEDLDIFVDEQNGFRANRSCEDHVFVLTSIIQSRLCDKKDTFTAFIDFSKAFDSIDRDLLLFKLMRYNIDGKIYFAIKKLFENNINCIRLGNHYTSWFNSSFGVRQGDVLSPTMFGMYINDLAVEINAAKLGVKLKNNEYINILLYADDIVLLSESEENLQKVLNILHRWCYKWRITVNETKSNIMHFRNPKKKKSCFNFKFGNTKLDIISKYKYLGILLDENLNFKSCVETLSEAGGRALSAIIGKFHTYKNITYNVYTKLYDATVWPILEYCASVWSYKKHVKPDQIQNRAIRYYLGVHKNAPILGIQADMGWITPEFKYYLAMFRYWNRLINMDSSRLTRRMFEYNMQYFTESNWCGKMNNVFSKIGLNDHFISGTEVNLNSVKNKLIDQMNIEWQTNVPMKPKLRTYSFIKSYIEPEPYVTEFIPKFKRSLLAQLRIGILPLNIEIGRYYRVDLDDRVCTLCNMNEIEDEIHFLVSCSSYTDIRNIYFSKYKQFIQDFDHLDFLSKYISILKCNKTKLTANFIEELWNHRKSKLFTM